MELIEHICKNGTSFTLYARLFERFTQEMAESMIGQTTMMNAGEFGVEDKWPMQITAAELEDNGRAIRLTFMPLEDPPLDHALVSRS